MLLIDTKATLRTISSHQFGRGGLPTVARDSNTFSFRQVDSCLQGTITNSMAEAILSESALAPYTATELQQMLDLTSNIVGM